MITISQPVCNCEDGVRAKAAAIDNSARRPYDARMAEGRVFVFGSINTDLFVYVAKLPMPGETVGGGTYASYPGGKGANQAVAAARAGAAVEMHGCLGDDLFGRERLASLAATGIATHRMRVLPGVASGVAQITVDAQGENTIAVAPGANALFSDEGIELSRPPRGETWVSLFQNEVPQKATERLILRAREAGHTVLWNLAPTLSRRPADECLRALDYLICNRNELAALTGDAADPVAAARMPLAWGVRNVIVTLGSEGSIWVGAEGEGRQAAFPVRAVDTVGAGDCYCGVLAASLAEGRGVKDAMRRASAAAAISATRRGAQPSMPQAAEIEDFLSRQGG
jgi:ribokinase